MAKNFNELRAKMSPESRARSEAKTQTMLAEMKQQVAVVEPSEVKTSSVKNTKANHKLAALLDQCDPQAQLPADVEAWDSTNPIGKEII
jgi:hypothetical protein